MTYTDEAIIAAIMTHRTNKEAIKALGMTERHFYHRLKDKKLQDKLQAARAKILEDAMYSLQLGMVEAADTLREINANKELNPQTRAYAANVMLQHGTRLTETVDILRRIEALENAD